ncbi:GNAT family N-acetyltransferase [Allosalinactinospora lopnorensis]|uniref:GNAT family N-acetyltransferase n=1 Tax=Allosalinactinospora lopnorensis TaxID=1352348 RepID=UPI000623FD1C|nr:GNAT family N-acetyltransferase [Allosalinactinospora lopnorensis]
MKVIDVPQRKRYEGRTAEGVLGVNNYRLEEDGIVLTHAEVAPSHRGLGHGGRLVRKTLDDISDRGLRMVPVCPFVKSWIRRNPEYSDLVDPESRSEVVD